MSGQYTPDPALREFSDFGLVLPGAKLYTWVAGSVSTPLATYSDPDLAVIHQNANPIVASAGGLFGPIFLTPTAAYKFLLTDQFDVIVPGWPRDNITAGGGSGSTPTNHGVVIGTGTSALSSTLPGVTGQVLSGNGGAADPIFQTIPAVLGTQTANTIFAGPATGAAAVPAFRALAAADLSSGASTVLDRDVTVTDVTNSTAETTVYTFSVPGNTLGTTKTLRISLLGDLLNNAGGARTFTVRLKYGATTVLTTGANFNAGTAGANRAGVIAVFELTALNSAAAQAAKGWLSSGDSTTNNATGTLTPAPTQASHLFAVNPAVAEDSTAAKTLAITFQISSAEVTSSIRCFTVLVELV